MRQPELDSLLGAWALNAIDDEARRQVERYLESEPDAQTEAQRLRRVARLLRLLESPSSQA